jgi:large subunit ribosomal protein L29
VFAVKYQDIKSKTVSELYDSLHNLKKELLGYRIQKSMGQLTSTAVIRKSRRDVARLTTRLHELKVAKETR